MAGLCAPLSTLRQYPHGYLRMTRGRCGSLLLHRDGLAPSTPCRSPGALRFTPVSDRTANIVVVGGCQKRNRSSHRQRDAYLSRFQTKSVVRICPATEIGGVVRVILSSSRLLGHF